MKILPCFHFRNAHFKSEEIIPYNFNIINLTCYGKPLQQHCSISVALQPEYLQSYSVLTQQHGLQIPRYKVLYSYFVLTQQHGLQTPRYKVLYSYSVLLHISSRSRYKVGSILLLRPTTTLAPNTQIQGSIPLLRPTTVLAPDTYIQGSKLLLHPTTRT